MGSISPLGIDKNEIWENYKKEGHCFSKLDSDFVAKLSTILNEKVELLRNENNKYHKLDRSVLLGIIAAREAIKSANWKDVSDVGVNFGSSRGATELFENYIEDYLKSDKSRVNPLTSPTTTLGNISSWIANDLLSESITLSHSVTCSTSFHALLNGIAWINAGMNDRFIVGGSEAPLTPFTIAQMKGLKIYADNNDEFPCKSLGFDKKENTMILGEASASLCIEKGENPNALAYISGVGYASEKLTHHVSMSENADSLYKSMQMATKGIDLNLVDAVVMHAPGTIKGDQSEFNAIQKLFGNNMPAITSNKWKVGHTLGSSGLMSLEFALLMLEHNQLIESPYFKNKNKPNKLSKILINAVGFGGNAVSILMEKV